MISSRFVLLSARCYLESWEEGTSVDCLDQIILWPCQCGIILINNGWGRAQPTVAGTIHR